MWCIRFFALILLCAPVLAQAGTGTSAYTEPTMTEAGTALTALANTTIYWKQDAGLEQKIVVPATTPAGGGAISHTFTYVSPGACASTTVSTQVTASNAKESVRSPVLSVTKAGTPPPGDPTCLTPSSPGGITLTLGP